MLLICTLYLMSVARQSNKEVEHLSVVIKPLRGNYNLISKEDVKAKIETYLGYDVDQVQIKDLEINELEDLMLADPRVKKAEVFVDGNEKLSVWILQRQPIVRVMDSSETSYYLDEDGKRLELGSGRRIRVPVATGQVELYKPEYLDGRREGALSEVFRLATFIHKDPVLSALIEQLDVEDEKQIILIPKIGRQQLSVGDSRNLNDKFDNLKLMYKEGLPRVGWRKYRKLRLEFAGQVVAEKARPL